MKQQQSYEDAVLKTVMWWSEVIQKPMNQNNGGDSMTMMLLNHVAMTEQDLITPEKIKTFEETLTVELLLLCSDDNEWKRTLSVDYVPCSILSNAATIAGIGSRVFPCKSSSYIDKNNVATTIYGWRGDLKSL